MLTILTLQSVDPRRLHRDECQRVAHPFERSLFRLVQMTRGARRRVLAWGPFRLPRLGPLHRGKLRVR
jgi:hypothetical protein